MLKRINKNAACKFSDKSQKKSGLQNTYIGNNRHFLTILTLVVGFNSSLDKSCADLKKFGPKPTLTYFIYVCMYGSKKW